jgi:hypothetical protein
MSWLLLLVAVLGIALLHECAHVLVARLFRYRLLAWGPAMWGPVPMGVFVLFDDTFEPNWHPLYWPLQLGLPWLVTAASLPLAWAAGFRAGGLSWMSAGHLAISPAFLLLLSPLVSALGSLGDLGLVLAMPRLAETEPDLTLRDMNIHQALGGRPFFTLHGQRALQQRYGESARQVWDRARGLPPIQLLGLFRGDRTRPTH